MTAKTDDHLTEDQIYHSLLDPSDLSESGEAHLLACSQCRTALDALRGELQTMETLALAATPESTGKFRLPDQHPGSPFSIFTGMPPFARVVELARHIHRLLDALGAPHFAKTSGQDGLHVLLPLGATLDHGDARALAEVLARVVCAERPDLATVARPLAARGDKVYVDFLQNGRGKLIAAPLSVRIRKTPVSTSCHFPESMRSISAASPASEGLPSVCRSTTTAVSAAMTRQGGSASCLRGATARHLASANRRT